MHLYLQACQVRVTVGDSGLCSTCVTYFSVLINSLVYWFCRGLFPSLATGSFACHDSWIILSAWLCPVIQSTLRNLYETKWEQFMWRGWQELIPSSVTYSYVLDMTLLEGLFFYALIAHFLLLMYFQLFYTLSPFSRQDNASKSKGTKRAKKDPIKLVSLQMFC